jgi:hypothetical protein
VVFNVGTGRPTSILQSGLLRNELGCDPEPEILKIFERATSDCADISRIQDRLG